VSFARVTMNLVQRALRRPLTILVVVIAIRSRVLACGRCARHLPDVWAFPTIYVAQPTAHCRRRWRLSDVLLRISRQAIYAIGAQLTAQLTWATPFTNRLPPSNWYCFGPAFGVAPPERNACRGPGYFESGVISFLQRNRTWRLLRNASRLTCERKQFGVGAVLEDINRSRN